MDAHNAWEPLGDRARRYAASAAIRLAICMLRESHRLYRTGIIDLAGANHALHCSDKVWRFGWGLVKRKRPS
jgi:hypothetical protein